MPLATIELPARPAVPDQAARLRQLVDELMDGPAAFTPAPAPPAEPAPGRILTVTSGKGGVGKTFTAVNLAIAIARLGCRVSVVDADPGLANADVMCGLSPARRIDEGAELAAIEVRAPGGFGLVPGSVGAGAMFDESEAARPGLTASIRRLAAVRDLVIVDTGAGVAPGITACAAASVLTVVVVTPEPTSMADAYAMIKCLCLGPGPRPRIGVVVNQARGRVEASSVHSRLAAVAERFLSCRPVFLGSVSRDERVRRSIRARRPLLADEGVRGPARRDVLALGLRVASELGLGREPGRKTVNDSQLRGDEGLIARWRRRVFAGSAGAPGQIS